MGAHKGKRWRDKASKARYWADRHLVENKLRRITRCNGVAAARRWEASKATQITNSVGK